jgi:hypothetical protein
LDFLSLLISPFLLSFNFLVDFDLVVCLIPRYVIMRFHTIYPSFIAFLLAIAPSSLAIEPEENAGSRSAVPALTSTQVLVPRLLSIPSLAPKLAGKDGEIGQDTKGADNAGRATLTITADLQPTLAPVQPPGNDEQGVIGNINLGKLIGSASSSFLNDSDFQNAVLSSTNTIRAQHNATALVWNTTLVSYAQNWSQRCRDRKSVSTTNLD